MKPRSFREFTFFSAAIGIAAIVGSQAISPRAHAATAVGLWRFDEGSGTNVSDSSGLGNNGTLQGENGVLPVWTNGQAGFGGALLFTNDGVNHDYVNIPGTNSLQIGKTASDAWTITAWAYENTNSANDFVASYGRILVLDDGQALQLESGASGDDQFYTWARADAAWQIGWGGFLTVNPLLGQWEHWAVVYDGANLTVYLNGNQGPKSGVASQALSAAIGYAGYQGAIHIGTEVGMDANRNWSGMLDDVAVFNGALTQDEIQTVMSGDFSAFVGGPAMIVSQPNGQTVPAGGTATFNGVTTGQPPLQYQWYRDNAPLNGDTNATLVLTNAQPGQAGGYSFSVSNSQGGQVSIAAQLIVYKPGAELMGLWRFDEGSGTNVSDSSGLGNNGVFAGDDGLLPGWAPSQPGFGSALLLTNDAANHTYVDIPANNSLMIGDTASNGWTITAWAYESSDGTSNYVANYGRILVIDDGTALQLESGTAGDAEFYTWARANTNWEIGWIAYPDLMPLLDQWEHWAVVYDTTNLFVYRDGNKGPNGGLGSNLVTAPLGYPGYQGAVRIGTELGQTADRNWNGMLDDVAIFSVALTQSQIQTVMSGDFSEFISGGGSTPLAIALSSTNAVLSWPSSGTNLQVQTTTNLAPAVWTPVNALVVTNGTVVSVTTPLTSGSQFFRLSAP
ncbi:MAG TPA: LamG-like jellyroll fold domain-containing protein [Verrucomicrobiae bacterium]